MSKPTHLISYLLHNQPHDVEVESASEVLTLDQARLHLNAIHPFEWPNEITDVQVTSIAEQEYLPSSRLVQNAERKRSQASISARNGAGLEP